MKKRVTMKDIANQLDLSINAVSLALNDRAGVSAETRRVVLDVAEKLGYIDQSGKYTQNYSNKNICILLENRFFHDMQFYGRILFGLEDAAKKAGYDVLINSFEDSKVIPSCVEQKKVSGIIVVGKIEDVFLVRLKSYGIPVLLLDHTSLLESTDCVLIDNKSGTFKMTRYLIDKGFKKIGFFGGMEYSPSVRERFWGYMEAAWMFLQLDNLDAAWEYANRYSSLCGIEDYVISQDIEQLGASFLNIEERPQVLICSNDKAAILLYKALEKLGMQVPRDISIVGFDDIELSKMVVPGITTLHVNKALMGQKAVERLLQRMECPGEKVEKILLDVALVERDSVKKAEQN